MTAGMTRRARRFAAFAVVAVMAGAVAVIVPGVASAATSLGVILSSPADGTTINGTSVALSAVVNDSDSGSLDVTFQGRIKGATVPGADGAASPFTFVVLPDTQNYTYNNLQNTISAQSNWVVNGTAARIGDI